MSDSLPNLGPDDVDRLGQALLTLAGELWVVKDRVRVLEALLTEAGLVAPDAVSQYQPGSTLSAELADERQRLIRQLLDTLAPADG